MYDEADMYKMLNDAEKKLIREGKKVQAIKDYRARNECGLPAAFRIVESYDDGFRDCIRLNNLRGT